MTIQRNSNAADGQARLKALLAEMDAKKQPSTPIPTDDLKIKIQTVRSVICVPTVMGVSTYQYREELRVRKDE
ncbi:MULTISPECIES: hypothetical protein [Pseudomonas syringae group]|uniref:Uncharacterized protein n=1 Tax=Pseudomonas syringae pv. ribicola TaxID=55398 RepID=A0A3M2VX20_PSESI|nr:hypothetical protein [Pseudomonas syringae group genomosp. 3]RML42938.1 hypothetical protein ALQ95_200048 [Pseudomonas syringae pv. ribicola]